MQVAYRVVSDLSLDTVSLGMGPVIELSAKLLSKTKRIQGSK